jgi:hypothetical protein
MKKKKCKAVRRWRREIKRTRKRRKEEEKI